MKTRKAIVIIPAFAMFTMPAFCATSASNASSVSPTVKVNVTVQSAISLTLGQGTMCPVTTGSGTDYNVSFGNVDALGISSPTCGNKLAPSTPGTTNAAYYTDYTLTPMFTNQAVSTNSITAYVSSTFAKANLSVVQSISTPEAVGDLSAISTSAGSPTTVATNATSGTAITRYLGVSVAPTNGASLTGADAAVITYTLTAQ